MGIRPETIEVSKTNLEEIEAQTARINVCLGMIAPALHRGDTARVRALLSQIREANEASRRTLIGCGVRDSTREDAPASPQGHAEGTAPTQATENLQPC
jgi:hypothetical protein